MLNPILAQFCPKCGTEIDLNTNNDGVTRLGSSTVIHTFGRVCPHCKTKLDATITANVVVHEEQS